MNRKHLSKQPSEEVKERFWSKVEITDDCWLWLAYTNDDGYGRFRNENDMWLAHCLVYEMAIGPIPEGMHLDHTCHGADPRFLALELCPHRRCVRPTHLEPVTPSVNQRRSRHPEIMRARFAAITHCPHGHEYSLENTAVRYLTGYNTRHCRMCDAIRAREKRALMRTPQLQN